jgi:hypothetical protein
MYASTSNGEMANKSCIEKKIKYKNQSIRVRERLPLQKRANIVP